MTFATLRAFLGALAESLEQLFNKTEQSYPRCSDRILKMRRLGALAYGFIVHLSRNGYVVETYDSPADFLKQTARRDPSLPGQEQRPRRMGDS